KKPKILVVDDEKVIVDLVSIILSNDNYEICKAFNGEEAISQAKKELPDLIILDYTMPVMDGFSACKILKADPITKDIPVIFWTGNKSIEHQITGYDLGAEHYILKPFHSALLKVQIRNSLRRAGHKLLIAPELNKVPKVFISYKWEGDDHNDWVMNFAVDLRSAGIDASLDRWEVRYGDSFTDYMTSKISEADVLLFIMTTASVDAVEASAGKGGAVKFEMQLASSRKIAGENFRIIPIYREGNKTAAHLKDHRYADFRDDSEYGTNIQLLISDLLQSGSLVPPLGALKGQNSKSQR
ncbi:MAG TPA: response regulator, partial [Geobacteraceae bacterium]